jgi:hypothetical protein
MGATTNLQRKLQQTLGAEAAGDLGAWMHSMDAHRTDMAALRREMQLGFATIDERFAKMDERFTRIDERFARVDERFARMDGRMDVMTASFEGQLNAASERFERLLEKGLREQTRFFFLAWSVVLASIIGLYAR